MWDAVRKHMIRNKICFHEVVLFILRESGIQEIPDTELEIRSNVGSSVVSTT